MVRFESPRLPFGIRVYLVAEWPKEAVMRLGCVVLVASTESRGVALVRSRRAIRALGLLS